jgi:hypothetical protein
MIDHDLLKHRAEFRRALTNHKYEVSDEGIFFPKQHAFASGVYIHDVNGLDERRDSNLLTIEGLNHMLDTEFHDGTKVSTWYVKLFSGNVTVLNTWTAANFTANATEITSGTEGYSESTAPAYVEAAAAAGVMTNTASKAVFTIATATSVSVWGAALSSSSTKGGTTGTLMSASKFGAVRTLYNTDVFNVGYSITLTST